MESWIDAITAYRGDNHITAQNDRDINMGLFPLHLLNDNWESYDVTNVYILPVMDRLRPMYSSTKKRLTIKSGVLCFQGLMAEIPDMDEVFFDMPASSEAGYLKGYVYVEYRRDSEDTGTEEMYLGMTFGSQIAETIEEAEFPDYLGEGFITGGEGPICGYLYCIEARAPGGNQKFEITKMYRPAGSDGWSKLTPETMETDVNNPLGVRSQIRYRFNNDGSISFSIRGDIAKAISARESYALAKDIPFIPVGRVSAYSPVFFIGAPNVSPTKKIQFVLEPTSVEGKTYNYAQNTLSIRALDALAGTEILEVDFTIYPHDFLNSDDWYPEEA